MAHTHGTVTRPDRSICCSIYCIHCIVVVVAVAAGCSNILFWSFAICVELAARHGALRCPKRTVGVLSDQKKGSWEREGGEKEANSDDRLRPVGRLAWPGPHLPLTLLFGWGEACVSCSSSGRRRSHSSTKREREEKEGAEEAPEGEAPQCAECEQSIMIYNCPTGSLGLDIPLHAS